MSTLQERTRDRSELGVVVLLVVLGGLVLWDASQIKSGVAQVGAVGPKAVPYLVGGMLIVCAVVLAVMCCGAAGARPRAARTSTCPHPSDWRTVALLVAAFLANVVLIEPVGWWFSGAVLFWGCAYALGSRRYVRRRRDRLRVVVRDLLHLRRRPGYRAARGHPARDPVDEQSPC